MEDDLFTYELGIIKDFHFPCIEQPHDNLANDDLDVYEPRVCYDENEQIYAEAVVIINKRLVRLVDITVEQWLDLKFIDHKKVDKEIMEEMGYDEEVLTNEELCDLEEEKMSEDKEIAKIFRIETDIFDFETPLLDQEWFDSHEEMQDGDDDDDIIDLDDYLIRQDASYYVDEEEERFKERKSKLLGMPYEKPPIFKSKKFKAIKY
nr:hypothetical protein [Tanacetum cinerariifolium]